MLSDILKLLATSESLSLTQMAQSVGHSIREVEGALDQLENMGYLKREQLGKACGSSCGGDQKTGNCSGCSLTTSGYIPSWILTERGKQFSRSKDK